MNKSMIKSLILGLLITTSLYQVITLWFDNVSDRNVFYSFINLVAEVITEPKAETNQTYMINPRHLGVYLGASDKDFTIVERGTMDYSSILENCSKMISKVLGEGKLEQVYEDPNILWENRGLTFTLSMPLTQEALASDLNVDSAVFENISMINTIGLIPANDKNKNVKAYFIPQGTHQVHVYALAEKELRNENTAVNAYIEKMEGKGLPAYISTMKNDIELFSENILLPLPSENVFYYDELEFSIPYIKQNEFDMGNLEKYINCFFDNPNAKWTVQYNDVMIYGDDNALVKYNKNGLLEYSSTENDQDVNVNLASAYDIAEKFLERGKLDLEYYLKSYKQDGGETIFYFDYGYNHLPIHLDQASLTDNNVEYPIEVTVKKGKVIKYKRLLIDIRKLGGQKVFNSQFEKALNQFVGEHQVTAGQLEDMYLGYVNQENKAKLMWVIESQGAYYWLDLN